MDNSPPVASPSQKPHFPGTLITYCIGFVLSLLLTIAAYVSVTQDVLARPMLVAVIIGLAIVQLLVQFVFFLHLGREQKPRYNLLAFWFMILIVGIVVGGSLWIMDNLDYRMMGDDMEHYMLEEEGISR